LDCHRHLRRLDRVGDIHHRRQAFQHALRISHEEKVLADEFGKEWEEHVRRTKMLIPFLF
jgi:hypothetical protein